MTKRMIAAWTALALIAIGGFAIISYQKNKEQKQLNQALKQSMNSYLDRHYSDAIVNFQGPREVLFLLKSNLDRYIDVKILEVQKNPDQSQKITFEVRTVSSIGLNLINKFIDEEKNKKMVNSVEEINLKDFLEGQSNNPDFWKIYTESKLFKKNEDKWLEIQR